MTSIELRVSGMSCGGCEKRITTALERTEGVRRVEADHVSGQVRAQINPELIDRGVLVARIEAMGYDVVGEESTA